MAQARPILSPERRKAAEIIQDVLKAMMETIEAALDEAPEQVRALLKAADLDLPSPHETYFESVAHQRMF